MDFVFKCLDTVKPAEVQGQKAYEIKRFSQQSSKSFEKTTFSKCKGSFKLFQALTFKTQD